MPVQINQLHVKIKVKDEDTGRAAPSSSGKSAGKKDVIVQQCVEAVMEILDRRKQR